MLFLCFPVFLAENYWETEPDKKESMRDLLKGFSLKKAKIRVSLEIADFLIYLGIFYYLNFEDKWA